MYTVTAFLIIALFLNGAFIAVSVLKIIQSKRESAALEKSWKGQNETT